MGLFLSLEPIFVLNGFFVVFRDPNDKKDEFLENVDWRPYSEVSNEYLDIGNELVMQNNLHIDRYESWYKFFSV